MDVKVKNSLPSDSFIGLQEGDTFGLHCFLHCLGNARGGAKGRSSQFTIQGIYILDMRLNRHNHVAWVYLTDIHEGKGMIVFIYHGGSCLSIYDFAEYTIAHNQKPYPTGP
jgi:hypothetical protein